MSDSQWTVETLKEYVAQRFADNDKALQAALVSQEKAVAAALAAAKEAVAKAELSSNKQFDTANNVKATFSGELNKKLDRTEYDAQHKALEDRVTGLTDRINTKDGKGQGLQAGWIILLGVVSLMGGLIAILVRLK